MTRRTAKLLALRLLRAVGAFRLAGHLTRRDLRVLCYHGFSVGDEHRFRPALFMAPGAFEERLRHLRDRGYPVLPLGEALARLRDGTLPARAVALTIDDGFYTTLTVAAPLLARFRMPAAVYLTTYHVVHQDPIFNLSLAYLFWRSEVETLDLSGLGLDGVVPDTIRWAGLPAAARERYAQQIVAEASVWLSRPERRALLERVAERAGVPFDAVTTGRRFALMTAEEAAEIQTYGVTLELHTHRHRSPGEEIPARRELVDNAAVLRTITDRAAVHFCHPSGRYDRWRDEWLAEAGVESATTCVAGFVDAATPRYQIPRFLDGADIAQIEFEAEVAGVLELARRLVARFKGRPKITFHDNPAEGRQATRRPAAPATVA